MAEDSGVVSRVTCRQWDDQLVMSGVATKGREEENFLCSSSMGFQPGFVSPHSWQLSHLSSFSLYWDVYGGPRPGWSPLTALLLDSGCSVVFADRLRANTSGGLGKRFFLE